MRKIYLALAGAMAFGFLATGADAAGLGNANGLLAAAEDLSIVESVHCVPGFGHHRYRPHNGCYRGIVIAPRIHGGDRARPRGGMHSGRGRR